MTAATTAPATNSRWSRWSRSGWKSTADRPAPSPATGVAAGGAVPPLSPRLQVIRAGLIMVFILAFTMLLQLVFVGSLQHSATQERKFDAFRSQLARGTAPIGPTDSENRVLTIGSPVAFLEVPEIGISEVVVEGTTPSALFGGPGHRRDTVLPGQAGTSIVMARRASFGGPFSSLDQLEVGDTITVTTGQGEYEYEVIGLRAEGDPVPPPPTAGSSRLVLATADGRPFLPEGVFRVDADLVGEAVVGPPRLLTANTLPTSERFMGADTGTLWALALWIQALILLAIGAVWAWHRWGQAQAWIVFLPPLLLVGLATSGEVARLLPNLL